ncbi:NAD(P)-dependent oxidoreductase [Rhizobacter sp. Root1221]|uniref:NAD(P)-dependent oxidoreductase n=1 Tax=Rhizobacter sp. Root1221 TaxID=1736433 RepID=UPI0006F9F62B|nr:NAD(P)-binding domain-containing protein [Rhizobacter sp. Root1221]KQW01302.1 3-hydroxyisobutyrate dehydrogenase [Rhizobacter sp. Root1221]
MSDVTIVGLGAMGSTIAQLFIRHGLAVTVWNRTPEKAAPLVAQGARLAPSASAAVLASPVVVMCVYDHAAAAAILAMDNVAPAVHGRLLVQLTTFSPKESRDAQAWARHHGARYLAGAIQAAPSQMGQPDTPLLLSGPAADREAAAPLLKVLAGGIVDLGEPIAAAATMDLATLSYIYGASLGFLHGARIAESEGFDVARFGDIVAGISPSFGAFLKHEGHVIQSDDFTISESPLRISVEATQRLLDTARQSGIDTGFPAYAAGVFRRGHEAGLGGEEMAALVKVLR